MTFLFAFIRGKSSYDDCLATGESICPVDASDIRDAFPLPAYIDHVVVVVAGDCFQDVDDDCTGGVRHGGTEGK